jgi:hypothetical protein
MTKFAIKANVTDEQRAKVGNPTLYRPDLCDDYIALRADGFSMTRVAAHWNIVKETLYKWGRAHEEFSEAMERGLVKYDAWLEESAINNFGNPKFNDRVFKLLAATKAGWSDRPAEVLKSRPGFAKNPVESTKKLIERGECSVSDLLTVAKADESMTNKSQSIELCALLADNKALLTKKES